MKNPEFSRRNILIGSTVLAAGAAAILYDVIVRPARSTVPRATTRSPDAGASRLILNSTASTPVPAGIRVSAA